MSSDDATDVMACDAKILSAGMMYRSRRRRVSRKQDNAGSSERLAEGVSASASATEKFGEALPSCAKRMFASGSFEEDSNDDKDLVAYVTRDLTTEQEKSRGMVLPSGGDGDVTGSRREILQRRSSVDGSSQLKEVISKLEQLGDEVDVRIDEYIRSAMKELSIEYGDDVTYSGYRGVVAKLFGEFRESWMTIAALYRMSDEILEDVAEKTGTEDPMLQAQLQDYNSRAIVDLAGSFWNRVGGMTGILTASKKDLYGIETEL